MADSAGALRARLDAIAARPRSSLATQQQPEPVARAGFSSASVRPSQVRKVLAQAALQMHFPESRGPAGPNGAGSEYDRLRSTLRQLKLETQGSGLAAVSQQIPTEAETLQLAEHVNAQVRSVQRAFGLLADTLEDEVGTLRAADTQLWEQLKVHAAQFDGLEPLRSELEKTREALRSTQSAFEAYKNDEHPTLCRRIEDLSAELAEQKEMIRQNQRGATERDAIVVELGALRRWRAEVIERIEVTEHRVGVVERAIPPLPPRIEELEARLAKYLPELVGAVDAAALRHQGIEEEAVRMASVVESLGEAHAQAVRRLDDKLRQMRSEARADVEAHEALLRQAAVEREAHAEALRALGEEATKARHEAREEADTIAAAVRASQVAAAEASEGHDRALAALRSELSALHAGAQSAAEREAQTLEAVLKLRTSHNQVSAWMEYVQRELGNVKGSVPPLEAALQEVRGPS